MNILKNVYYRYKNSFLFAISAFIIKGLGALTLPVFTRLLTKSDYGILSVTNTVQNFSTATSRLGIQQSVLKQYEEYGDKERSQYLFSTILFSFIWSLFLLVIFVVINQFLGNNLFKGVEFFPYLFLALLTSSFSTSYAIFQSYLRILNIAKKFIALASINIILNILLSIILITQFNLGVYGKLLGGVIPYFLIFIYIITKTNAKFKLKYWLSAIKFGSPLAMSSIILSIVMMYTISLLTSCASLNELGLYNIGRNLGLLIPDFVFQSIILTYQPFIYRNLRENNISEIIRQNTFIIMGLFIIILLAGLFGKLIILIFTTKKYLGALMLMRLFMLSYIFKIIYFYPMLHLFYDNKTLLFTKIEIFSTIIFLVLVRFFIILFSIEGVALALICQEFIKAILLIYYSKLQMKQIFSIKALKSR